MFSGDASKVSLSAFPSSRMFATLVVSTVEADIRRPIRRCTVISPDGAVAYLQEGVEWTAVLIA